MMSLRRERCRWEEDEFPFCRKLGEKCILIREVKRSEWLKLLFVLGHFKNVVTGFSGS